MSTGFGIVGLGLIAEFHARAIAAAEGARLAACMSRDPGKAARFAQTHGGRAYSSVDALVRDPDVAVVCVCTPSGVHLESALAAIEAGRHVVVEKPLEITLERCDQMIEAATRRGVQLAGVFPSRFHDVARVTRQAVDAGRLGRLALANAYVKWYRSQEYYDGGGWKGTQRYDGGGALMNQSIHAIDLLQWLAGPVESVHALTATLAHERIEVEDTAVAVLRFANGALGSIEGATSVFPGFYKRIELLGAEGSIALEEEDIVVWRFADEHPDDDRVRRRFGQATHTGGGASDPAAIGFHGHQRQFEDLLRVLNGSQAKPLVDGEEARKSVAIILSIYESARNGREVRVG
ncbi:MAG: gfo/Idh/MocA family oxidoreductase [Spirochaetaceae bacterium]|nr:MAG: gfo/Idh/MocA family oxidoreductase [Spirochaetaceae bacterium]